MEGNLKNNSYNLQVQKLKRYVQFSKEEEKLLARLKKILAPDVTKFVEDFYKHLLHFQETKKLLDKSGSIERLKKTQTQYYLSLFQGKYSRDYFEQRLKIGLAHEKIGLSPQWYLGAYGLYYQNLFSQIVSAYKNSPSRIKKAIIALSKLLLLDMQVAMEAYMGKALEVIKSQNEQLAKLLSERTSQLRELEVGYSDLVENSPEMIFSMNQQRQFLSMNRTGLAKLGYTLEEFKIKGLEDLMPDFYKPRGIRHIQDVIETGFGELEAVFVSKEGKELQLEISSTALYNSSGQLLKAISVELERLIHLTEDYLQFARLPKPNIEPVSVKELLSRLTPLLGPELDRKGIQLNAEVAPDLPSIAVDRNQLMQVLLNLIRNSEEAMLAGGKIQIQAIAKNSIMEIKIADTGVGIEKEDLDKIFDPFYTTKDTGTGLGLSFIRQVMNELGGSITCESQKNQGTAFTLFFPLT